MPNQDQPDPNQSQQQNTNPVPFSPQADLPPLPPEFQNLGVSPSVPANTPPAPGETSGSAAPPTANFSNIAAAPKKKFGGGKIIATILSIFLVVGGVVAGTYLVKQKQIFQQKAAGETCSNDSRTAFVCRGKSVGSVAETCWKGYGDSDSSNDTNLVCESSGTTGNDGNPLCGAVEKSAPGACGGGGGGTTKSWPPNGAACKSTSGNPGTIGGCVTYFCPNDCSGGCGVNDPGVYWEFSGSCSDSLLGNQCGQIDTVDTNKAYCVPDNSSAYKDSKIQCGNGCTRPPSREEPPATPVSTPVSTPVPTPVVTASPAAPFCSAITIYDSDWNLLSSTDRSSLTAGANINFCVTGYSVSGDFDKARFIINGVQQADTTTKKPGSEAFCQSYSIPENTTTFTVSGQIHHSTLGWF